MSKKKKKRSHKGHEIITETQYFIQILKFIFTFPYFLAMYSAGKIDKKQLFWIYHVSGHFFKDAVMTYNLIMINCLAFIILVLVIVPMGVFDTFIISPENFYSGNLISLFTGMFFHQGFMHLLGNMLFLFVFGRVVEKYYGSKQMLLIYFGSGLISAMITSAVFLESGIGASGAISGLVAAAILIRPFYLSYIIVGIPLPIFFLGFLQIAGDYAGFMSPSFSSNVGHIAHLIGYASVMLIFFVLKKENREQMTKGLMINLLLLGLFVIINILF